MAVFLTESELNHKLSDIIEKAKRELILISPYIKLHERLKSILISKMDNPDLEIFLILGKNENNKRKSISKEDFEFFKQFPNIEIRYEKRLHAKLYANENEVLITSMNLYDYSQNTNIENGILFNNFDNKVEKKITTFINRVIEQSDLIFSRFPVFEGKYFGLSYKYVKSKTEIDNSKYFFENKNNFYNNVDDTEYGYCIRTGVKIPYNRNKPFSGSAYNEWRKYRNGNFPENFCHLTGEPSNGKTSFNKPILSKNWKLAMEYEKKLKGE